MSALVNEHPHTIKSPALLKDLAKRGALWVSLTSVIAIPLAYYRSWVLGQIGASGEVVGSYAIILLFIQFVVTFVLFGGINVMTNFLPKIVDTEDKSAFVVNYGAISIAVAIVFSVAMNIFPGPLALVLNRPVDTVTLRVLSALVPLLVVSQLAIYSLAGLMEFRLTSLLLQVQLLLVCAVASFGWLLFPNFFQTHSIALLASVVGAASIIIIVIGVWRLRATLPPVVFRRYLPRNFWRFSSFIHLNSVTTFAYQSIDQLAVLAAMGTAELGAYYISLQCAQLINFVPQRIGQVMLASFSRLVAAEEHGQLCGAYTKLCRLIAIMSTVLALLLVCFSYQIASVFGEWAAARHEYLLYLAAASHIGSLGSVNSMLILAKEKTGLFLANNLVLISLQLAVTLLLLEQFGVYAVIAGRALGSISAQLGLFSIIRWRLDDISLAPPREYWYAIVVVIGVTLVVSSRGVVSIPLGAALFVLSSGLFLAFIRFRPQEILEILRPGRRSPPDKSAT